MITESIKVSILVPIHNVEPWIERCVRSLFEQTYPNLEFIFVNDNTQDKSIDVLLKALSEYPERKDAVVIIENKENQGVAYSRDLAVKRAQGEFVCFVDADDWLELNAIELMLNEQIRTSADVVWGKALMHTPTGNLELQEPLYADRHEWMLCYSRLTQNLIMVTWRRLILRSLFIEHNISAYGAGNYSEDKVIMTQIAYFAQSYSSVDNIVYHYNRINRNSSTAQQSKDIFNLDIFNQEMKSIGIIEKFLRTKEIIYYDEMMKSKLSLLMERLLSALRCSSRIGYNKVKSHIDAIDDKYYHFVGLDNIKAKLIYSNYYVAKVYWWIKR